MVRRNAGEPRQLAPFAAAQRLIGTHYAGIAQNLFPDCEAKSVIAI